MKLKKPLSVLVTTLSLLVALGLLFTQIVLVLQVIQNSSTNNHPNDFKVFYFSPQLFRQTGQLYSGAFDTPIKVIKIANGSPPAANLPFFLLSFLPFDLALIVWYILGFVAVGVACYWIFRVAFPKVGLNQILRFFILVSLLYPLAVFLVEANWTAILFFLGIATWNSLRRNREIWGGGLLGLTLVIRLHPFVLWFYLLFTRRFKAAFTAVVVFGVANLLALIIFGFTSYLDWLHLGLSDLSGPLGTDKEISWLGLVRQLAGFSSDPFINNLAMPVYYLLSAATVGFTLYTSCRPNRPNFDQAYNMTIIAGLLVVVPAWEYYAFILLLPIALLWKSHPLISGLIALRLVLHTLAPYFGMDESWSLLWRTSMIILLLGMLAVLASDRFYIKESLENK